MKRTLIPVLAFVAVLAWFFGTVERRAQPSATPGASEREASSIDPSALGWVERDAEERRLVPTAETAGASASASQGVATGHEARPQPVFHVAGNLVASDSVPAPGELLLRIRESIGSGWKDVARLDVTPGDWGPVDVPIGKSPWFLARLEGRTVIPQEHVFEAPAAGGWVHLSLEARTGIAQWFLVTDTEDNPLSAATVSVGWRAGTRWVRQQGSTDESGYVKVTGIEPGAVIARASREGYVPLRSIELVLPPPEPETYPLALARAGSVRGRCTWRGEPVQDFAVAFWEARRGEGYAEQREFAGRQDGAFELDELPLGDVFLVASSAVSPGSRPISITVPRADDEPVELELLEGGTGEGSVVDDESGEPLADATVQGFVRGAQATVMRWGPPLPVRADASFVVGGILPGSNLIEVTAPGHATRRVSIDAAEGETVSFGAIRLPRTSALTVRLAGVSPEACPRYQIRVKGAAPVAGRRFEMDADGDARAVLSDVSPGYTFLSLLRPDASSEGVEVDLAGEQSWEQTFRASGGGELKVEIDGDASRRLFVLLSFEGGEGVRHTRRATIEDDQLELRYVEPGTVWVEIRDEGDRVLGRRAVTVTEGSVTTASFTLEDNLIAVTVVDEDGDGLAGVLLRMRSTRNVTGGWYVKTTGAGGRAELGVVSPGAYLAHLTHAEHGMRFNVPVHVAAEDEEIELELTATGALALQFLDGDVPIASTTFHLADQDGVELTGVPYHADDTGRVVLDRIAPCTLRLSLFDERLWHVEPEVQVGTGVTPHVIQVRRLGDLRVEVRNTDGVPVSGMAVELTSTELQASVGDWVASGRVQSSSAVGATDQQGRLTLRGLPNGTYAWRLLLLDGTELVGTVQVKAEAETRSLLVVP